MINQTFNIRKVAKYKVDSTSNLIEFKSKNMRETKRKFDSFERRNYQFEKLNLIIDIPDRW